MEHKKGNRIYNRSIIRFFRNLTKHVEVETIKTEFGYIFFAAFDNNDLFLWVDRESNMVSLTVMDCTTPDKPKLH